MGGAEEGAGLSGANSEDDSDDASSEDRVGALVDTEAGTLVDTHAGAPITELAERLAYGRRSEEHTCEAAAAAVPVAPKREPGSGHRGEFGFVVLSC